MKAISNMVEQFVLKGWVFKLGKKILVVDDEKPIVDLISFNLKKEGHEIIEANDGEQAYNMALSEKPDLILLDVMLPKMDGLTVCKKIRTTLNVPILMLTARDEEIDKISCLTNNKALSLKLLSGDFEFKNNKILQNVCKTS